MVETTSPSSLLSLFGLNGFLFAAQLVNFLIVVFVLHRWVYKPLLRAMDERAEKIRASLAKAAAADSVLQEAQERGSMLVHTAEKQAHALLEKARSEGEAKRRELLVNAREELDRQITETKVLIQEEREQMVRTAKKELVKLVVKTTNIVTDDVLAEQDRQLILEKAVKKLPV